jgi:hypothetical protein
MKRRLTVAFAAIWFAWAPHPVPADVVQQNLDAKITSVNGLVGTGILVGDDIVVRVLYDDGMVDQSLPGSALADTFTTYDPPSNGVFDVGVEIQGPGFMYSTVAKGDDGIHHEIEVLDTAQLDQWNIDMVTVLSPVNQASITLRGDTNYVLPGDEGLTGAPIFPPNYCDVGDSGNGFAIGNFTVYQAGELKGSLIYDFLQGPTCASAAVECGDANADSMISATDALVALRAGIGVGMCLACLCDVDQSGTTSATDALAILRASVGQPITLNCSAC